MQKLLQPAHVLANLKVTSKKQVLQELAHYASELTGINERRIFEVLLERERLGTTGVGHGIAIPHGKFAELEKIHGMFARLQSPVDFDAVDDEPVDLMFLLLAPEDSGAEHLKALAKISRLLRDETIQAQLRGTEDAAAIFALLSESAARIS